MRLVRKEEAEEFSYDITRIVDACAKSGYEISRADAKWAWEQHSESMAAGWICLPEDDEYILPNIRHYFQEGADEQNGK